MTSPVFTTHGYYERAGLIYHLPSGEPWWGTWYVSGRFCPNADDVRWWQQHEREKAQSLALRYDRLTTRSALSSSTRNAA